MKELKKSIFLALIVLFTISAVYGQWTKVNLSSKQDLMKLNFLTDSVGYCVGDSGVVFKTIDNGKNWGLSYADSNVTWKEIFFPNNKVVCFGTASDNTTHLRITSDDEGASWSIDTVSYFPNQGKLYNNEIYFMSDSANVKVLKKVTASGTLQFITDSITHFDVNSAGIMTFYHASGPIILKKKSHTSSSWQTLNFNKPSGLSPNSYTWSDFRFFGDSILLKASYGPIVVYSFDNGANWIHTNGNGNMPNFISRIVTPFSLYGIDNFNRIQYSNNTGVNWVAQDSLLNQVNELYFLSVDSGFLCGENGSLFRTVNGGSPIGIKEREPLNDRVKITPNPANDRLQIRRKGMIAFKQIYLRDLNGKIVKRFDGNAMQLDVSDIAKGTYFIQFMGKQTTFAKKVVLE